MKAKTKRRIKHLVTKKKLVKAATSRHFLRSFAILLASVSMGAVAYAIAVTKPVVTIAVHGPSAGQVIVAPSTPTPIAKTPGSPDQVGRGSWYAYGLPAPDAVTCASRTFPRGSYLQVTDLYNGNKVVCHVNDYGPEVWTGRVIDLSRGAFIVVDNLGRGTIPVEIRLQKSVTGVKFPVSTGQVGDIVGYSLCARSHTSMFCDTNRQN
jgi:rare lipoprotein A (peptidoglycan hydrolase)